MRGVLVGLVAVGLAAGQEISTTSVVSGISAPTDIQNAGDGSGRLFFVQQNGVVRVWKGGALVARPFLDISSKTKADGERGLLGLAFPPRFAQSQRFYVHYTDLSGNTTVAMYRMSTDPDAADVASETVLLKVTQPFANHNGGQLRFGPDGYLYLGLGDGGSGGDPLSNGQNRGTLLGKILRMDVESQPGTLRIPADNPLTATAGARGEIWAYGLRNPWRFSFDRDTGDLWIADVGQDTYEEIDFQAAASHGGENYGWNRMEGLHCYTSGCSQAGVTLPIAEYTHAEGGCSVTGGFVYRGRQSPGLRGIYLYGDLCSGKIWGVERQGGAFVNRLLATSRFSITTFGEDEAGEVYVADAGSGTIYRIGGSAAPRVSAAGVVNAASFAPGIVPGSLATIFAAGVLDAPGIVSAPAGVSVTLDGIAAPVQLAANRNGVEQVNVYVPVELEGRTSVRVIVTRDGRSSAAVDVTALTVQPAVYTSDGVNAIVVHNATYVLATEQRPLAAGEYAFLYATGLGRAPDVRVTLGGQACEVQYAGVAPGFLGVYQVNFRVPQVVPTGIQEIALTAAGAAAPVVKTLVGGPFGLQ
jgi:uncharacterized protein (TIGR03437 family)